MDDDKINRCYTCGEVIDTIEGIINGEVIKEVVNNLNAPTIKVRGIYKKINGYDKLVDESDSNKVIDISFRGLIPENTLMEVEGTLALQFNKSGIYPKIKCSKTIIVETSDSKSLLDVLQEKLKKFRPRTLMSVVEEHKGRLKCLLIHGTNAQTNSDFEGELRTVFNDYNEYITIDQIETVLLDDNLEKTIRENAQNYDVIFLVRGGGKEEELEKVGGPKSAIAILDVNKPFYIALGHSRDKNLSLLEKVSDYSFHTPSALGTYFGRVLREYHEKKTMEESKKEMTTMKIELEKLKSENNQIKNYLDKQEEQNKALLEEKASLSATVKRLQSELTRLKEAKPSPSIDLKLIVLSAVIGAILGFVVAMIFIHRL